jgi:hypothetical protein
MIHQRWVIYRFWVGTGSRESRGVSWSACGGSNSRPRPRLPLPSRLVREGPAPLSIRGLVAVRAEVGWAMGEILLRQITHLVVVLQLLKGFEGLLCRRRVVLSLKDFAENKVRLRIVRVESNGLL